MSWATTGARFFETTRGRVVALLRRGGRTVEDLAKSLGLTDNAVRSHLATLERDGIVKSEGVRRMPGAGKPATIYELQPDAEVMFSRAYAPVLRVVMDVLQAEVPEEQLEAVLRRVGHELAARMGASAPGPDELRARVNAAAAVLTSLGGDVDVVEVDGRLQIRGCSCPLAAAVRDHPRVCMAVEALVGDVAGATATSVCEHGARPKCAFLMEELPVAG